MLDAPQSPSLRGALGGLLCCLPGRLPQQLGHALGAGQMPIRGAFEQVMGV
jgi:hypothetical protein